MDTLSVKCERLRRELQVAYDAWLRASEYPTNSSRMLVDVSGCPERARAEWLEYLAAQERLILAFAEQPTAI
jgi:hypothetical protein